VTNITIEGRYLTQADRSTVAGAGLVRATAANLINVFSIFTLSNFAKIEYILPVTFAGDNLSGASKYLMRSGI